MGVDTPMCTTYLNATLYFIPLTPLVYFLSVDFPESLFYSVGPFCFPSIPGRVRTFVPCLANIISPTSPQPLLHPPNFHLLVHSLAGRVHDDSTVWTSHHLRSHCIYDDRLAPNHPRGPILSSLHALLYHLHHPHRATGVPKPTAF